MVTTQAIRMLRATPQRTPRAPRLEPTPMIALEMTWVVETGIPKWAVVNRIVAEVVSAAKPWTGSSSATRWPIVCMIRQPPIAVPSDSAVAATTMTQTGTVTSGITPAEKSARVMMPIVFCASFEPCEKAMKPADTTWTRRKIAADRPAPGLPEDPVDARASAAKAPMNPRSGEMTIGIRTLPTIPPILNAPSPAATSVAPSRPPISAWLLELGRPTSQVRRFQVIAPISAAMTTAWVVVSSSTSPEPIVLATAVPANAPDEVEGRRHHDRLPRMERPRRDGGRDRVGGVVEAVDVVEDDGQNDDRDEQQGDALHVVSARW